MQTQLTFDGVFSPQQEKENIHLPFAMPDGATRLDVGYSYSNQISSDPLVSGGNTVDLGVFDARGIDFLHGGFRGWSGSERLSFFISETAATPGYLPGPLQPGQWHVLLGLYKIAPDGCTYHVTVTIDAEPGHHPAPLPGALTSLPCSLPPGRGTPWLCGELHCHSYHSDGELSPAGVVALARQRGLDFLAISDHNSVSNQRELAALRDPGLILIPAVEVTTFKGHFNVWGTGAWVDFRVRSPQEMAAVIDDARQQGAVTSCGHPKPYGPPWDYTEVANYDCIEVWNGPWWALNQISLDVWLGQIAKGRRLPAIAGSDWHRRSEMTDDEPRAPGTPAVWLYVPGTPSQEAILQAIRQGHITMSDDITGPMLDLRAGAGAQTMGGDVLPRPAGGELHVAVHCQRGSGHRLDILDQDNTLLEQMLDSDDTVVRATLPVASSRFVRAELRADTDDAMKALTNPVYLTLRRAG